MLLLHVEHMEVQMRAADVMTLKPVTVSPDASIMEAIRLILERKFSGLPVMDTTVRW